MAGKVLMVQGTASHVGKSVMVSALCRIFRQDGFRVAPFKAQNMSNNSYVTAGGGEIGRAQAVQADAAGVEARVEMNPILLKPEADHISQVVVMGRPLLSAKAKDYFGLKPQLWEAVHTSLDSLRADFDIVVVEGAGSPAEANLREGDIANMGFAEAANVPVVLCADIERGGVLASLVGTHAPAGAAGEDRSGENQGRRRCQWLSERFASDHPGSSWRRKTSHRSCSSCSPIASATPQAA